VSLVASEHVTNWKEGNACVATSNPAGQQCKMVPAHQSNEASQYLYDQYFKANISNYNIN